ncbi:MAG: helix-turn-helix transcriptional regulator [Proteobacteria bacterium]|nr:helix-turn-helix transcriptional regulator [Pseudomonadota bacterium]
MDNILSFEGPSDVQKIYAKSLKELRLSKGLTQKTLAQLSGVAEPSLKRFEHSGEISFASLLKISAALEVLASFKSLVETFKAPLTAEEVRQRAKKKVRVRGSK